MEKIVLELPEQGYFSWETVARCAKDANMPLENWITDAIESKMRRQDTASYCAAHELWPSTPEEETPIPIYKKLIGNVFQSLADILWDSIDADLA